MGVRCLVAVMWRVWVRWEGEDNGIRCSLLILMVVIVLIDWRGGGLDGV